jgi:hypothetical protein
LVGSILTIFSLKNDISLKALQNWGVLVFKNIHFGCFHLKYEEIFKNLGTEN